MLPPLVHPPPQTVAFDLDRPWRLSEGVSLRPEPFGALAYHFGTRRLTFLKSPTLLGVVESLAKHPTAREACIATGVPAAEMARYRGALAALADTAMISERGQV